MNISRSGDAPLQPADATTFAGSARRARLVAGEAGVPVVIHRVEFDVGGRTNWHTHSGPQWLLVIEGRVRVQRWGEPAQDVNAGDTVAIAPGEKHWHGAAPGSGGAHFAVNVNATTEWLEAVSEEQYGSR